MMIIIFFGRELQLLYQDMNPIMSVSYWNALPSVLKLFSAYIILYYTVENDSEQTTNVMCSV